MSSSEHLAPKLTLPERIFDCIVFNDVLEHMVVPEQALRYAKTLLSPNGSIVASIPNIRYLPILWHAGGPRQMEIRGLRRIGQNSSSVFLRGRALSRCSRAKVTR